MGTPDCMVITQTGPLQLHQVDARVQAPCTKLCAMACTSMRSLKGSWSRSHPPSEAWPCRTQAEFRDWAQSAASRHGYSVALSTLGRACLEEECGLPGPLPEGATQVWLAFPGSYLDRADAG